MHKSKVSLKLNKPVYVGRCILDVSKVLMHEFHYGYIKDKYINPLSAKFIKWSNTLKQIVGKLPTICLSVFDHFSGLAFKVLNTQDY